MLAGDGSTATIIEGAPISFAVHTISVASNVTQIDGNLTMSVPEASQPTGIGVVFMAGGYTITAQQSGDSVMLIDAGSTQEIAGGAAATLDSQMINAVSAGAGVL
ncbi:hypothetical protein LTR08_007551 [Meristemomyces frigidus]|nr:hypothetical protein LTR08_007551 [Meristemomyces frigidus]